MTTAHTRPAASKGKGLSKTNQILRLPIVGRMLRRKFTFAFPGYEWVYRGKTINCDRFLMLYEHVGQSLIDAVLASGGRALDDLLILLDLTDPAKQIYSQCFGIAGEVELFAVASQHGSAAVIPYSSFMRAQVRRQPEHSHIVFSDNIDRDCPAIC